MEYKSFIADIEQSIIDHWGRPALSDYKSGPITFSQVGERIARLHILFEHCGIKEGDHIALCGRNCAAWAISYFAVLSYGAVAVPLLHEFKAQQVEHLVNHSDCKLVMLGDVVWEGVDADNLPDIHAVVVMQGFQLVYCKDDKYQQAFDNLTKLFKKKYPQGFSAKNVKYRREKPEDLALINYTSGTTSASKGVMVPYKALMGNQIFADRVITNLNEYSNSICMLPMAHMYGMSFELITEFRRGTHIHFLSRVPSPKIVAQALSEVKPDIIISVPLIIEKIYKTKLKPILDKRLTKTLLRTPYIDKMLLSRIQKELHTAFGENFYEVIIGGAAINQEVEAFLKKVGFRYTIGYGMTECAPIICYADWKDTKLYSCGKAVDELEIKIDSPDPSNIPGEVLVKGDNVMLGYYKNEEETAKVIKDGWLHTGDLAVMDADGYIYIKGRIKNMILSANGQNIYPEEIEDKLNSMEYVNEALVIEKEGKITALVNLDLEKLDRDKVDRNSYNEILEQIRKDTNAELPAYEQISQIFIQVEEFEKTPKRSIKRYMYTHRNNS
ncbi:MAG: AMP-binding protein [Bacteroidales bacterium]|nr:AMP-binding protein [Bacteroidales bacterium]